MPLKSPKRPKAPKFGKPILVQQTIRKTPSGKYVSVKAHFGHAKPKKKG